MPSLGNTYQIENELDELITLRCAISCELSVAALAIQRATRGGITKRKMFRLWESLRISNDRYILICNAIEATEKYLSESPLLGEVRSIAEHIVMEKRDSHRDRLDEKHDDHAILKSILMEIRAVRDRVDSPALNAFRYIGQARKDMTRTED